MPVSPSRTLEDLPLLTNLLPDDYVHARRSGTDYKVKIQTLSDPSLFGGDRTYIHDQIVASSIWTVNHDMNKLPSVMVMDSANSIVIGEITYIDENSLQIAFSAPFSGRASLN